MLYFDHRGFLLVVAVLACGFAQPLVAQDNGNGEWKIDVTLGVQWSQERSGQEFLVETGFFHSLFAMERPDFFDFGGRVALGTEGIRLGAGVRHTLYFSPVASLDQEVLAGLRLGHDQRIVYGLLGSFGGGTAFDGNNYAYPAGALEVHLTWLLGWYADTGEFEPLLGFNVGFGGNFGVGVP